MTRNTFGKFGVDGMWPAFIFTGSTIAPSIWPVETKGIVGGVPPAAREPRPRVTGGARAICPVVEKERCRWLRGVVTNRLPIGRLGIGANANPKTGLDSGEDELRCHLPTGSSSSRTIQRSA